MSAEVAVVRPAFITQETRHCLGDYRAFRHVVRNVYAFNLQAGRLRELTGELRACYQAVCRDVSAFTDFLEQLTQAR
jgi:hypothetical protein